MTMKNPPHPGRILRQECIEPLGLTITEAASRLGVKRQTLNNLVNEKAGISTEMSIRLSKAFGIPGVRIGWIVGPEDLVHECWTQHDAVNICPNKLSDAVARIVGGTMCWIADSTGPSQASPRPVGISRAKNVIVRLGDKIASMYRGIVARNAMAGMMT